MVRATWQGIWFDGAAGEGGPRSPEPFRALAPPRVYPYVHGFIEEEERRILRAGDPGVVVDGGERRRVFYALVHDGAQSGLDQQGCRIVQWLMRSFEPGGAGGASARFSEIPVVIQEPHPAKAAALANALALLRFLGAAEDQAVAKIALCPWRPLGGAPRAAAEEQERRLLEFLHGETLYPEGVTLFDVLDRQDLRAHRDLGPCCLLQMGYVAPLLEWVDDARPSSDKERADLLAALRRSLADEARELQRGRR